MHKHLVMLSRAAGKNIAKAKNKPRNVFHKIFSFGSNFFSRSLIQGFEDNRKISAATSGVSRVTEVRNKQILGTTNRHPDDGLRSIGIFSSFAAISRDIDPRYCPGFVRQVRPGLKAAQKRRRKQKSGAFVSEEIYAIALFSSHRFKTNQGRKPE